MFKSEVYKTWALVLQLGISMLVPIFLLVFIAYFVNTKFEKNFMLVAIILGVVVGVRNVYAILKNYLNSMKNNNESELMKKHLKSLDK